MSEHTHPAPRFGDTATSHPGPEPSRLAGLLARAWLEVRARRRPLGQLAPHLAPAVLRRLAVQIAPVGDDAAAQPARVRRVTATRPSATACEAVVVVEQGERTTAIAVRLERHRGGWRATELAAPEAGLPALRTASCPSTRRPPDAFDEVLAEVGEDA
jgi:hypothetical protein